MSNTKLTNGIAALSQETDGKLRSVVLKKEDGRYVLLAREQIAWGKESRELPAEVASLVSAVGKNGTKAVAMGSSPVAFYRMQLPPVSDEKAKPIVRMQLETLLPVPIASVEISSVLLPMTTQGRKAVAAVARQSVLQRGSALAQSIAAEQVFLDCQALVKAWQEICNPAEQKTLLMRLTDSSTQAVITENGRIFDAKTFDSILAGSSGEVFEPNLELLLHDIRSMLEADECVENDMPAIHLICSSRHEHGSLVDYLYSAGLNVARDVLCSSRIDSETELASQDLCEYLLPIGTAMLTADQIAPEPNLYASVRQKQQERPASTARSVAVAVIVLLAVLVAGLVTARELDERMFTKLQSSNADKIMAERELRTEIARNHPEMLELLTAVTQSLPRGMMLDSFVFAANKPVVLTSNAGSFDQLFEFQKNLLDQPGVKDVTIQNPSMDEKTRKVSFRINFHFKNYTGAK